ncbi:MAG: hypothetical protein KDA85_14130 [Planctomycetaceae bacterium]|nr:hypothetical protein [Planctomycetaceae bacterium]
MKKLHEIYRRKQLWFPICLLTIVAISLYDTWLLIKFQDFMVQTELNPVGQWLLRLNAGDIWVFVHVKLAGTFAVLTTLVALWKYQYRRVYPVTVSVAWWQVGLLFFLTVV